MAADAAAEERREMKWGLREDRLEQKAIRLNADIETWREGRARYLQSLNEEKQLKVHQELHTRQQRTWMLVGDI